MGSNENALRRAAVASVVSYVLASLTSMVTALCYVEFAVECPVAGSAYNFVAQAFGEFAGYVAGCNLGLELTISAAAVARGWTSYVCTLFRADPDALRVRLGGILLDVPAALLVAAVKVGAAELVALTEGECLRWRGTMDLLRLL